MWIESDCGVLINMDKVGSIVIHSEIDSHSGIKFWHIVTDTDYYLSTFKTRTEAEQELEKIKSKLMSGE